MYSVLPERCAQKWLVVLVDEARTTFWGIIEELVSESSKPAELRACSSFSLAIPEDALAQWHAQRGSREGEGRKWYGGVARPHRLPLL